MFKTFNTSGEKFIKFVKIHTIDLLVMGGGGNADLNVYEWKMSVNRRPVSFIQSQYFFFKTMFYARDSVEHED